MATLGHTLVGLTLATVPLRPARRHWAAWWPGVLVLGAHFLDVGEWLTALTVSRWGAWHMLHTWGAALGCAAGASLLLWRIGGVTRIGPHLLLAAAILSHMLMDSLDLGREIRRWYREPPPGAPIDAKAVNLPAEIWCYGYLFVTALLLTAAARTDRGMVARRMALLLAPIALIAFFLPMMRPLWIAVYALCAAFAAWMLRPKPRAAWCVNGLFVLPILALGAVEAWSIWEIREADGLQRLGAHEEALTLLHRAAMLPTRTDKTIVWWRIGRGQESLGRLREAEGAMIRCVELDREWHWSELILADFYLRHRNEKEFYQPEKAAGLLYRIIEGDRPEYAKESARREITRHGLVRPRAP